MPAKRWRIGVDTTMRIALIRRLDISCRLRYMIPVRPSARHRDDNRKTPKSGGPRLGLGARSPRLSRKLEGTRISGHYPKNRRSLCYPMRRSHAGRGWSFVLLERSARNVRPVTDGLVVVSPAPAPMTLPTCVDAIEQMQFGALSIKPFVVRLAPYSRETKQISRIWS